MALILNFGPEKTPKTAPFWRGFRSLACTWLAFGSPFSAKIEPFNLNRIEWHS